MQHKYEVIRKKVIDYRLYKVFICSRYDSVLKNSTAVQCG